MIEYNSSEWDHISTNGRVCLMIKNNEINLFFFKQSFVANLLKVNVRDRLTVNQAFSQPWIREKVYRSEKLTQAQMNINDIQTEKNNLNKNEPQTFDDFLNNKILNFSSSIQL